MLGSKSTRKTASRKRKPAGKTAEKNNKDWKPLPANIVWLMAAGDAEIIVDPHLQARIEKLIQEEDNNE